MIAVAAATQRGKMLVVEVCPSYDGGCQCGESPAHPLFEFSADPVGGHTPEEWAHVCSREALLLVHEAVRSQQTQPLPGLAGFTL